MTEKDLYFDWAATSPADADILQEALNLTLENWGNPSSAHAIGKKARNLLEEARIRAAHSLGVKPECLYFTSGGTESDQIPLLSVMTKPTVGTVLVSSIEHPAVREQAMAMKHCGWTVVQIPSDKYGIITPEAVTSLITKDTMIICVMAVNNETGAIQPIYEIADAITQACKGQRKPKFHVDCVQAAGKITLNLAHPGIDSAAFSAHKICGPRGIGLLYSREPLEAFLRGGGQEKGMRSGTENVFGAQAFSKCLERYYNKDNSAAREMTERFIKGIS
ncbi:MAG: aminotransferase class V-fold PLP-dependent enzyme, partial [Treponema sp.]|nr:aminotransferase class V-fold PLP-dependent enzyme [Treponema sp.]